MLQTVSDKIVGETNYESNRGVAVFISLGIVELRCSDCWVLVLFIP
jgi:hypothetical protein